MQHWSALLQTIGHVRRFDYAYTLEGKRRPDPLPQLIAKHRDILEQERQSAGGAIFLVGKSMGGRVGCHVALEEPVAGVICFGYPLCGGGDCHKLRDQVLRKMSRPLLFVQGTRDILCPLETLATVRQAMHAENELYVVQGGDHSLLVTKTQLKSEGRTQEDVDRQILSVIEKFVAQTLSRAVPQQD